MKNNLIHFIMTGGTIDSSWDNKQDSIVVNEKSNIPVYFQKFNILDEVKFTQVCMKDSRALTPDDLTNILKTVEESETTKIIITHGRFTSLDTARFLKKNLKRQDQTIMLISGSTPIKGFEMSDSPFNLGFAVAKVQDLPPDVYICINGKAFPSKEVDKSIQEGQFHHIFSGG